MTANGIIRSKETILLDAMTFISKLNDAGFGPIWASKMVKKTDEETKLDDICIIDSIGDDADVYEGERSEDGQNVDDVPLLLPCLQWGRRKRVSYSICLSHAMSVSVAFDVVVVPTSWWADDCEGTFWVIQIVDANTPLPEELELSRYGYSMSRGYYVVGWASAEEEEAANEQALQE